MNILERVDKTSKEQMTIISEMFTSAGLDSIFAEQFRKIRAEIFRSGDARTILVTSATQGEGKTLVAANLAVMISRDLNRHSLLVEADLRNPVVCRYFSLSNGKGLADYLTGSAGINDIFLKTSQKKLTVVLAGKPRLNSGELLGSQKMTELVREMRSRYPDRFIIIDSPPLLETSDPLLLSSFVDSILVVIRSGLTPREAVRQGLANIPQEKIIGVILNDLKFRSEGMHKRYFGSYGYYGKMEEKNLNRKIDFK